MTADLTLPPDCDRSPTAVFVLEQTLGHITHSANLRTLVPQTGGIEPVFVPVEFDVGRWRLPGWSNWTLRAGTRARRSLHRLASSDPPVDPDVMFVHTQVPAVLLGGWMRRIPTVVSLDATPMQYDTLGQFYGHERDLDRIERIKHRMNRRCFERACHIVTWSEWARQGLIDDYGVRADRVTVIAPGVDATSWRRPVDARANNGPLTILFVGGDLRRKGGDLLIEAVRRLRTDTALPQLELHVVTTAQIDSEPGIVVHRGLVPNSTELRHLYHTADVFCLPTLGDCLPVALAVAAMAGLPLVSTDVGAIHEIVQPGTTGLLVEPGDIDSLAEALRQLAVDAGARARYGDSARKLAEQCHDARVNARRLIEILRKVAHRSPS
jgi:glycosyltransferase involved in cell wall biosynthesis